MFARFSDYAADGAFPTGADAMALQKGQQIIAYLSGVLVTSVGILLQRFKADGFQVDGDAAIVNSSRSGFSGWLPKL